MKYLKLLAIAGVTGVVLAGLTSHPVYAWHPEGQIIKYVQNQTTSGVKSDANTTAEAVGTKPGDLIKYTIVVSNVGDPAQNGYNDMHYTVMTDELPAGVELVSDPSKRKITENLGIIKPGQSVTKEYILKVTSTKNADVITNKACFTGDSEVHDNHQEDCDPAVIKVTVPPKPPELPKEPPTVTPVTVTPAVMPATGPANIFAATGIVTVLGYVGNLLRIKHRARKNK